MWSQDAAGRRDSEEGANSGGGEGAHGEDAHGDGWPAGWGGEAKTGEERPMGLWRLAGGGEPVDLFRKRAVEARRRG